MLTERHEQRLARVRDELSSHSAFTNWSESSRVRFLTEVFLRELTRSERTVESLMSQNQLETASGAFLDSIAISHGVTRIPARKASDPTDNVSISRSGSAGTSVIPQGTRISSNSNNLRAGISYKTLADLSLTNTQSLFVGVQAEQEGPQYNIGSSQMNVIDFAPAAGVTITVTNSRPISNGRFEESDQELRFRIVSNSTAAVPGTRIALQSFLDSSAEVISHRIEDRPNEVIITIQPRQLLNSAVVTAALSEAISNQVPLGTSVTIRLPSIIAANITVNIAVRPGINLTVIQQNVSALITQYINDRIIGEPLKKSQIESIVRSLDQIRNFSFSTFQGQLFNYEIGSVIERVFDADEDELRGTGSYLFIPGSIVVNASS